MNEQTVYVVFDGRSKYPTVPAYEGTDLEEAARTLIHAADRGEHTALRVRWRGRLIYGLPSEVNQLAAEVQRLRHADRA